MGEIGNGKAMKKRHGKALLLGCVLLGGLPALTFPLHADPVRNVPGKVRNVPGKASAAPLVPLAAEPVPHPDESWATPGLVGTRLAPRMMPFVAETDQKPQYTRQIVRVKWRLNDPIDLYVIRPAHAAKPPVVLFLYGYPNDAQRFLDDSYCQRVTRAGCAAVGFESALTGGRYHDRPMREWFVSELAEALASSAHDVHYILDYLATRGDLDMTRVGMFGEGSGGAVAVLAAGADPRIKALDLLNPWGDWPDWAAQSPLIPEGERPRYVTAAFQKGVASLDPVAWLPRLKGRPLRLIQVKTFAEVPLPAQAALSHALPAGGEGVAYEGNLDMWGAQSEGRLFAWLGRQLKDPGTATRPSAKPADFSAGRK